MANTGQNAAACVAILYLTIPAAARAGDETVTLQLVDNRSTIERHYVEGAQRDAAAIYQRIGVSLVWTHVPVRHQHTLKVVLAPSAEQDFVGAGLPGNAMGVAMPGGDRVYIFCDRVRALALKTHERVSIILGRVIAHELGHLMLGEGHASEGVMRAKLDYTARDAPAFSSAEGHDIRERLASWNVKREE